MHAAKSSDAGCVCVCEVLGEGYLRPVMLFKVGEYESCVL